MQRNIKLAYFLSFAFHSWFWMGNWIFYYLRFGNYATVSLLDSGAVMASLLAEVPTGAFTDLIGKKKALMLAFLAAGVGNILMGLAGNFWMLALSLWLLVCIGGAFYSGTMESLLFDSLKQAGREDEYDRHIGGVNAVRLWSMAVCSAIGGLAYGIYPGLPLILNGVVGLIGLVACFYLVEPKLDTEKYSWISFFRQNTLGIKTLFSGESMRRLSVYLIGTGALSIVIYNILDDLLAVEWGYGPIQISILFAIVTLIAGFASMFLPRLKVRLNQRFVLVVSMIMMALLLTMSPFVGMYVGGVLLMFRVIMEVFYENATSVMLNQKIESRVRATTLSSLNLLRSVPYAVAGGYIGVVIEQFGGARMFSLWFGLVILVFSVFFGSRVDKQKARLAAS